MHFEFGDRLFWGILLFLAVFFVWLGILEKYAPLWLGAVLGLAGGVLFVLFGPGTKKATRARKEI